MTRRLTLLLAACTVTTLDALAPAAMSSTPRSRTADVRVVRYGDDRLTGITTIDVVVPDLDAHAASCGLSRVELQDAAVASLRAAGIKASVSGRASSWFYTIYVTVGAAAEDDRCVSSIGAELMAQVEGIPEADRHAAKDAWGSLLVGQMSLAREGVIISSSRAGHRARAEASVRDQVGAIGARIRAVNPSR